MTGMRGAVTACVFMTLATDAAVVTNVRMEPRPAQRRIDLFYDLEGAPGPGDTILVRYAVHGTPPRVALAISGDIGPGLVAGTGKHIDWQAGHDFPDGLTEQSLTVSVCISPTVYLPNNVPLRLIPLPTGSFLMGSNDGPEWSWCYPCEQPVHQVAIGYEFYLGVFELTQRQWMALMGTNPGVGHGTGDDYAVYFISWNDCQAFLAALNAHVMATGQGPGDFRLPSEAEWEYACRAGTTTRFYFGDSTCSPDVVCDDCDLSDHGWWCGNDQPSGAKPVGGKPPNPWGLYDMHGNVWEWCQDRWHETYHGAPADGSAWIEGTSTRRVLRGGRWNGFARGARSSYRLFYGPPDRYGGTGARVARTATTPACSHSPATVLTLPSFVRSTSHPDPTRYYANRNITWVWDEQPEATAWHYRLTNQRDASVSENDIRLPSTQASLTASTLDDGSWYLHLAYVDGRTGRLSRTYSAGVGVDTVALAPSSLRHNASVNAAGWTRATSVTWQWEAPQDLSGVAGYAVAFQQTSPAGGIIAETTTTQRSYTASPLSDGAWRIQVVTVDRALPPNFSPPAESTAFIDTTPPEPVAGLRAACAEPTGVNLAWDAPRDGAGSGVAVYHVYRSAVAGQRGNLLATIAATIYLDLEAAGELRHYYTIVPEDRAGWRQESGNAQVGIGPCRAVPTPTVTATPSATPLPPYLWDHDDNGYVDERDLLMVLGLRAARSPLAPVAGQWLGISAQWYLGAPLPRRVLLPGGVPLDVVPIPTGVFRMGSLDGIEWSQCHPCEQPIRDVTINVRFSLAQYEITQGQWRALMGTNPVRAFGVGDDYPVHTVSWEDCIAFCAALNAHVMTTGQGPAAWRLPSEAEWEYACRAGTQTRFSFGDSDCTPIGCTPCDLASHAWYCGNNQPLGAKPVGGKPPNPWGLYDMHGNVWEWCQDRWHETYHGAPADGSARQDGASTARVMRGGSWSSGTRDCRTTQRAFGAPGARGPDVGFRVVRQDR